MCLDKAASGFAIAITTLWLQEAAIAMFVIWIRRSLGAGVRKAGLSRSYVFGVLLTTAVITFELEIVLWASFYRRFFSP